MTGCLTIELHGGPADGVTVELNRLQDRYHWPLPVEPTVQGAMTCMDGPEMLWLPWAIYELRRTRCGGFVFQYLQTEL